MIDTHAHLNDPRFSADLAEVRARARRAGVDTVLVAGYDLPSSRQAISIAAEYGDAAAVGVQPHSALTLDLAARADLERMAASPVVVAIGETGLDYHYDHSPRDVQRTSFAFHIQLAKKLHLPLIIHCRDAFDDLFAVLAAEDAADIGGVVHCFTGGPDEAARVMAAGLHVGVAGVITFPKAHSVRQAISSVPLNRLLLETDCPYMAPHPFRGHRCEPLHVAVTAQKLADLFGISPEEAQDATDANALRCFPRLNHLRERTAQAADA